MFGMVAFRAPALRSVAVGFGAGVGVGLSKQNCDNLMKKWGSGA